MCFLFRSGAGARKRLRHCGSPRPQKIRRLALGEGLIASTFALLLSASNSGLPAPGLSSTSPSEVSHPHNSTTGLALEAQTTWEVKPLFAEEVLLSLLFSCSLACVDPEMIITRGIVMHLVVLFLCGASKFGKILFSYFPAAVRTTKRVCIPI